MHLIAANVWAPWMRSDEVREIAAHEDVCDALATIFAAVEREIADVRWAMREARRRRGKA